MVKKRIVKTKNRKTSVRKSSKKVPKRKVSRKVVSKKGNSKPMTKKDFETFKFGVERLKELERELKSLNTRGFAKDVQRIRSKLKTVSEIPNIEREMKVLKMKIRGKYKPVRRKSSTKEIKEKVDDIQEEIVKLRKSSTRKRNSIDPKVDALVDTNFNNFLTETKKALSDRILSKEHLMDDVLKEDLVKREEKYKKKNENLIRAFKRKYDQKVATTLHQEVAKKLRKMLKAKFDAEKVRLGKQYKAQLKAHFDRAFEKHLESADKKLEKAKREFAIKKEEERKEIKNKLAIEAHNKVVRELAKREKELRAKLRNEYDLLLKKQIQAHEEAMKKKKIELEMEMSKKIKEALE